MPWNRRQPRDFQLIRPFQLNVEVSGFISFAPEWENFGPPLTILGGPSSRTFFGKCLPHGPGDPVAFLDMDDGEAAGVFENAFFRVDAGKHCPANIKLKPDAGGIRRLDNKVVYPLAAFDVVHPLVLRGMIMYEVHQAKAFNPLGEFVAFVASPQNVVPAVAGVFEVCNHVTGADLSSKRPFFRY